MYKIIIKSTILLCSYLKIKKFIFVIQNRTSQRNNQIFESFRTDCFAFTAWVINKAFTQDLLSTKQE